MNTTYKQAGAAIGGVLIGSLMVFSFQVNGEVIEIQDDGVSPIEQQLVTIKITQEVEKFSGTLEEVEAEIADIERSQSILAARKSELVALKVKIETELSKLPERGSEIPEQ